MKNAHGDPDSQLAQARYRSLASGYDASSAREMPRRVRAIELLQLAPGDAVLDVACGTGLSLPLLRERVGAAGRVVGIELVPEMAALAQQRINASGWRNVTLLVADTAAAQYPCHFNAVLFHYTHDVLQSAASLEHIFAHAHPGARIAAAGLKTTRRGVWPLRALLNQSVVWRGWRYRTTERGLDAPWQTLLRWVPDFTWQPYLLDTAYIGCGTVAHKHVQDRQAQSSPEPEPPRP